MFILLTKNKYPYLGFLPDLVNFQGFLTNFTNSFGKSNCPIILKFQGVVKQWHLFRIRLKFIIWCGPTIVGVLLIRKYYAFSKIQERLKPTWPTSVSCLLLTYLLYTFCTESLSPKNNRTQQNTLQKTSLKSYTHNRIDIFCTSKFEFNRTSLDLQ